MVSLLHPCYVSLASSFYLSACALRTRNDKLLKKPVQKQNKRMVIITTINKKWQRLICPHQSRATKGIKICLTTHSNLLANQSSIPTLWAINSSQPRSIWASNNIKTGWLWLSRTLQCVSNNNRSSLRLKPRTTKPEEGKTT